MLASLEKVSKTFAEQQVLRDVSAEIHESDRIGLIGRNGAGKSTLIRVLLGQEIPDEGNVFVRDSARIGYMSQNSGLEADGTVIAQMRAVFSDTLAAQKQMDQLAAEIEANPDDDQLQKSYDHAMSRFLAGDGYNVDVRIRRVLNGMGFANANDDTEISTMSGGEKTRLALARLLLQEPELLILDEPTNHLDMRTLTWLEEYLTGYKGALLVVSHDRFFLDRVTQTTWELEDGALDDYKGNYSAYLTQREMRKKEQLREYEKQQVRIAELKDYIARNQSRASTAAMAKSRQKQLEKLERLPRPKLHARAPRFRFSSAKRPWTEVLSVQDLDLAVGEEHRTIVENVTFDLRRGARLAVIGSNGAGKSTLLRELVAAAGLETAHIVWGRGTEQGYYEQENRDLHAHARAVDEVIQRVPGLTESDARSLLGNVLLEGDDAFKLVRDLSGGERAKLGLAILMAQQANVLLLDEPTNHLDLPAREALEDALRRYDGTVVFVSHDRYFVNALADHVLAIEDGKTSVIEGNYDAFTVAADTLPESAETPNDTESASRASAGRAERRARAAHRARRSAVEKEIAALEQEERQLRDTIAASVSDYEVLQKACDRLQEVTSRHDIALEEWLELVDNE